MFLQGADLFALTSHSENFGVSVLEAMAVGLPVLVTPGVALAPVVAQNQLGYVAELNVSAIVSSLQSWLNEPQQARIMGDRARQLVSEKYALDRVALNLKDTYTALIKRELIPALY
jgi:glycosyltransferase involved in cell wall biosynthesis